MIYRWYVKAAQTYFHQKDIIAMVGVFQRTPTDPALDVHSLFGGLGAMLISISMQHLYVHSPWAKYHIWTCSVSINRSCSFPKSQFVSNLFADQILVSGCLYAIYGHLFYSFLFIKPPILTISFHPIHRWTSWKNCHVCCLTSSFPSNWIT